MDGTLIMLSNTEMDVLQAWADGEIAPVIHAHWINHFDDLYPVESTVECSNCHEEQMTLLDNNYCPNCGAKMDEEVGDGK